MKCTCLHSNVSGLRFATRLNQIHHFVLLSFLLLMPARVARAEDCPSDSSNGGQDISAQITIAATGQALPSGSFVAPYTALRLDALARAYGHCTPMLADCTSSPCSCTPLQTYERTINHIKVWSEISTSQSLNGVYTEGYIYGWDENHTTTSYHELDSHSSLSTGPIYPFVPYAGTYTYHIIAYINGTPCNLEPYETEELIITLQVRDPSDNGTVSCNARVPNPVNVTNGNITSSRQTTVCRAWEKDWKSRALTTASGRATASLVTDGRQTMKNQSNLTAPDCCV